MYKSIYEDTDNGQPLDILLNEYEVDLESIIDKLDVLSGTKMEASVDSLMNYDLYLLRESPETEIKKVHLEMIELTKNYKNIAKLLRGVGGKERFVQNQNYCQAKIVYSLYRINKYNENVASQNIRQVEDLIGVAFQDNRDLKSIVQQLKRNTSVSKKNLTEVLLLEKDTKNIEAALNVVYDIIVKL